MRARPAPPSPARRRVVTACAGALAAAAWRVRAQPRAAPLPRIGVLNFGPSPAPGDPPDPIVRYLAQQNYVAGSSVVLETRYAEGDRAAYVRLGRELLQQTPDVLFLPGSDIGGLLAELAPTIPVVFAISDDPVAGGVVPSLSRPGGRVTGVTHMSPELAPKRLQILREAVPGLARVAVLHDPDHPALYYRDLEIAARAAGVTLVSTPYRSIGDFPAAFEAARHARAQAMFVEPDRATLAYAKRVAGLAIERRMPAISAYDAFVRGDGLLSYGATANEILGRAAAQIDKILHGTPPGELPVEQPVRFALVVNRRAADAMGLALPRTLVLRADEVIS